VGSEYLSQEESAVAAKGHPGDLVLTRRGLRFGGRFYPCSIGRGGIATDKREGDGATPAGAHEIVGLLYRPDRIAPPADWAVPIRPGDLWSDDPDQPDYNLMVARPYPHSHEVMRRADPLYDLVMVTDWNWPDAVPGRGSCIFMHQWRRPGYPTEGCVALRRDHLAAIAARVQPGARLIVRP
jgi:L,D-peptidoglycan transpeptidase YkuD (ErfK/YbiS/YcfS/YnhG family)